MVRNYLYSSFMMGVNFKSTNNLMTYSRAKFLRHTIQVNCSTLKATVVRPSHLFFFLTVNVSFEN